MRFNREISLAIIGLILLVFTFLPIPSNPISQYYIFIRIIGVGLLTFSLILYFRTNKKAKIKIKRTFSKKNNKRVFGVLIVGAMIFGAFYAIASPFAGISSVKEGVYPTVERVYTSGTPTIKGIIAKDSGIIYDTTFTGDGSWSDGIATFTISVSPIEWTINPYTKDPVSTGVSLNYKKSILKSWYVNEEGMYGDDGKWYEPGELNITVWEDIDLIANEYKGSFLVYFKIDSGWTWFIPNDHEWTNFNFYIALDSLVWGVGTSELEAAFGNSSLSGDANYRAIGITAVEMSHAVKLTKAGTAGRVDSISDFENLPITAPICEFDFSPEAATASFMMYTRNWDEANHQYRALSSDYFKNPQDLINSGIYDPESGKILPDPRIPQSVLIKIDGNKFGKGGAFNDDFEAFFLIDVYIIMVGPWAWPRVQKTPIQGEPYIATWTDRIAEFFASPTGLLIIFGIIIALVIVLLIIMNAKKLFTGRDSGAEKIYDALVGKPKDPRFKRFVIGIIIFLFMGFAIGYITGLHMVLTVIPSFVGGVMILSMLWWKGKLGTPVHPKGLTIDAGGYGPSEEQKKEKE